MYARKPLLSGENLLQSHICSVLLFVQLPFFSVPNGAYKSHKAQKLFAATGLKSGVPDLFICRPFIFNNIQYHGAFIEVNHDTKNHKGRITPNQLQWHQILKNEGYFVIVIRSLNELYRFIYNYYPIEAARINNIQQLIKS